MNKFKKQEGFTLIEILVVIGIIALLAAVVIIAINPARQFAQARDSQRTSNVNAILNAIGQKMADDKGLIPSEVTTTLEDISNTESNLCALLVPTYLPALLVDPEVDPDGAGALDRGEPIPSGSCGGAYNTGYTVQLLASDRITVTAPNAEVTIPIEVTR